MYLGGWGSWEAGYAAICPVEAGKGIFQPLILVSLREQVRGVSVPIAVTGGIRRRSRRSSDTSPQILPKPHAAAPHLPHLAEN